MADQLQRSQFIAALVDLIEAGAVNVPNPGLAKVEEFRDAALARIGKSKGQIVTLIQGMLNGKQGQLAVGMSAMELFSAASEAIRTWTNGQPVTSCADFTSLQR